MRMLKVSVYKLVRTNKNCENLVHILVDFSVSKYIYNTCQVGKSFRTGCCRVRIKSKSEDERLFYDSIKTKLNLLHMKENLSN